MIRSLLKLAFLAALPVVAQQPAPAPSDPAHSTYILGPEDQVMIRVPDAEEISEKPVRIDMGGNIRLPMVGRLRAGGLTAEQLEAQIAERLGVFLNKPDVSVSIMEFRSQPVSVIGSVKTPGVQQLQGRKTLVEVLSMTGGLADDAGHTVKITRRIEHGRIPLANAHDDPSGKFSVAEVKTAAILDASSPHDNIVICPEDVISVPRGELIYVTGQVTHAGGFVLKERESLSVLQALSLAGGLDKGAAPANTRILRAENGGATRTEIAVDLKKILASKAPDMPMQKDDILFVPADGPKKAIAKALEMAVPLTTSLLIYSRY